ncbi:helix-turn-helix domain-containing protein [Saxibacter everestensis]|uniref:Helix-turn-helix domain-containing protein n=1 Tax=Saxibacter everestensis TaxID=2909229 RepID=A0ABY8QRZ4_9MICO|nr:helix-turn-helix domain-containing protein [Brevibacteriaceae bacterium ZFBP1038]
MDSTDYGPFTCGLDAAMDVVGGKWKPLILWELHESPQRFNALHRNLARVSQKVLTQQLRELEEHGVVNRRSFNEVPPRVEYSLTPAGVQLLAALEPLGDWAVGHIDTITAVHSAHAG